MRRLSCEKRLPCIAEKSLTKRLIPLFVRLAAVTVERRQQGGVGRGPSASGRYRIPYATRWARLDRAPTGRSVAQMVVS
jgi:hypothetical protein